MDLSVCGWSVDKCACQGCWTDATPAVREVASALASALMWSATGRQFGVCPTTVQPCNPRRQLPLYQTYPVGYDPWGGPGQHWGGVSVPVIEEGVWSNRCQQGCTCRARCEVELPGPVADTSPVTVTVAGEIIDPTQYQIHNRRLLVRVVGGCWPTCQVFGSVVPGFEVTYGRGNPIPPDVDAALRRLACEFAKACTGKACGLPPRVASLTRQGVNLSVADVAASASRLPGHPHALIRTGIAMVDLVIEARNPFGLSAPMEIVSPDVPDPRTVTWQAGS